MSTSNQVFEYYTRCIDLHDGESARSKGQAICDLVEAAQTSRMGAPGRAVRYRGRTRHLRPELGSAWITAPMFGGHFASSTGTMRTTATLGLGTTEVGVWTKR